MTRRYIRSQRRVDIRGLSEKEAERLRGEFKTAPAAIKVDDAIVNNAASASIPSHGHTVSDISDFTTNVQGTSFSDLGLLEKSSDPANPGEGTATIWMSDGTGSGDDGDIMIKITAGGTTKTATLVDFSTV